MVQDQWTETCASPSLLTVCVCLQALTWLLFKMWQSSLAGVKLFVCVWVCLTMTCLGLKQQSICFHGLRQVCLRSWPWLCFIPGWLSDYEHPGNAFKTCSLQPLLSTLNIPKKAHCMQHQKWLVTNPINISICKRLSGTLPESDHLLHNATGELVLMGIHLQRNKQAGCFNETPLYRYNTAGIINDSFIKVFYQW